MMSCYSHNRKIASNLLLRGGELLPNPIVEVDPTGSIVSIECGKSSDMVDRSTSTEFYSGIMTAGFVNAHCHIELSYLHNKIEPHKGFAHFASQIGSVRNLFTASDKERAIREADAQMWREGVVAVGDISNSLNSFDVKRDSKISYHTFAEVFGLRTKDISHIKPLLERANTSITPHSTYSLNDKLFRDIVSYQDGNKAPLSIHFMESEGEMGLFQGEGYLHDWYSSVGFECDFLGYKSPAERIVESIAADRSILLVHNCCVTQRDIDIIMSHFTAPVYWVVCPRSNSYISQLTPPLNLLRRNRLNICVGTDSLASNWSLSMIEELKAMSDVPLIERLDWATRVGAAALRFDHLGDIEIGKRPGINILSGIDYKGMELTDKSRVKSVL